MQTGLISLMHEVSLMNDPDHIASIVRHAAQPRRKARTDAACCRGERLLATLKMAVMGIDCVSVIIFIDASIDSDELVSYPRRG